MATTKQPGWFTDRTGARYVRVPLGDGKRLAARLVTCTTDREADHRAHVVRELAKMLLEAEKGEYLEGIVDEAAKAPTAERLAAVGRIVEGIVAGKERKATKPRIGKTWADVADMWTSGDLSRQYPDRVSRKRSVGMDRSRIDELKPLIGHFFIDDPNWLDHAEEAMRRLPPRVRTSATRRQYAQVIRRVLELCVLPLRLIASNPLPRGFLPKVTQGRALQMPYPDEDAKLMAAVPTETSPGVPVVHRLAYGFLARMGFRKSEIIGGEDEEGYDDEPAEPSPPLAWDRVDLVRSVVFRERSKNDKPVPIVIDEGVCRALIAWKKLRPPASETAAVFVDAKGEVIDLSTKTLRAHLKIAGVEREELYAKTKDSAPVRVHDLRALFVTASLAEGKPDSWVRDRTSHRTVTMLDKYRRQARLFEELNLEPLTPLDEAIPELRKPADGRQTGGPNGRQRPVSVRKSAPKARRSGPTKRTQQTFGSSYRGSNPCAGTLRNLRRLAA